MIATPTGQDQDAKAKLLDAMAGSESAERKFQILLKTGSDNLMAEIRQSLIKPDEKRVYVAAASRFYPEKKQELLAYSRKLDYHRDAVSLVLKKYLAQPAK